MGILNRLKNIVKSNVGSYFQQKNTPDYSKINEEFSYSEYTNSQNSNQDVNKEINYEEAQYYANLELSYGASFEEVKKSYRALLKKYHPDLFAHDPENGQFAEKITLKLNEAYGYFESKHKKGEI